jgi:hypothetical protein
MMGTSMPLPGMGMMGLPPPIRSWHPARRIDPRELGGVTMEVFRGFDANQNGTLEYAEFYPAFCELCRRFGMQPPMPGEIEDIFDRFNMNDSMGLEFEEFSRLCENLFA